MADEVTVEPDHVLIPITGELVPRMEPARVAVALHEIRQIKQDIEIARRALEEILLEESRRQGTKTLRFDGVECTVAGGEKPRWDIEMLAQLVEIGLPEDRYDALVKVEVTYKVDARVASQLEKSNPEYAAVIRAARSYDPAPYRVQVVTRG